jgi:hypothetical protein
MIARQGTLDTRRATELLLDFLRDHAFALIDDDLNDHVMDLTLEGEVDQLCARLASDPETALFVEPAGVRALLSWRLVRLIASLELWPSVLDGAAVLGPLNDAEAYAFLIGDLLRAARLPSSFHGRCFGMRKPELVH